MPIYTRTGDKGKTSLFDGTRVLKSSLRVETYGTIDELNSSVGMARAEVRFAKLSSTKKITFVVEELEAIQHDLLSIGSTLATPAGMPVIGLNTRPEAFERHIDWMTNQMPELRNFILPGGGRTGALLHVCRVITRRAERQVINLMQHEAVDEYVVKYLNRLSDLFFTLARYTNWLEKEKEVIWKQK